MPSNYTGNATATQAPAATPAYGVAPIVVIPADGEALNVASIAQAFKAAADYIAYLQNAVNKLSFRNVSIDSVGGVATSATSDSPLLIAKDPSGNNRFRLDHNGLPTNSGISVIDATWVNGIGLGAAATGNVSSDGLWSGTTSANSNILLSIGALAYNNTTQVFSSLASAGNYATISANGFPGMWNANTSLVLEFDFKMSAIGSNTSTWVLGFTGGGFADPTTVGTNTLRFQKAPTDTNWQIYCGTFGGGAFSTPIDASVLGGSGVTPVANTIQRFRIEYQGGNTSIGAAAVEGGAAGTDKVRFFINGTRVATINSGNAFFPLNTSNRMLPLFGGTATATNSTTGSLGAVRCTWLRYLTPDAL